MEPTASSRWWLISTSRSPTGPLPSGGWPSRPRRRLPAPGTGRTTTTRMAAAAVLRPRTGGHRGGHHLRRPLSDGQNGQQDQGATLTVGDASSRSPTIGPSRSASTPASGAHDAHVHGDGRQRNAWRPDDLALDTAGVYTELDKANPVVRTSRRAGCRSIPGGVTARRPTYCATRMSTDGVCLHRLDRTLWEQGRHQCVARLPQPRRRECAMGLRVFPGPGDVCPGDVVEVRDTGGEPLQVWRNGDWSAPRGTSGCGPVPRVELSDGAGTALHAAGMDYYRP